MESTGFLKLKPRIRMSFEEKDNNAYIFWCQTFGEQKELFLDDFLLMFVKHLSCISNLSLNEKQILNVKRMIDPDYNSVVNIIEFALFYDKLWCNIHEKRNILKFIIPEFKIDESSDKIYQAQIFVEKTPKKHYSSFDFEEIINIKCMEEDNRKNHIPPCILAGNGINNHIIIDKNNPYLNESIFKIMWSRQGYKIKCLAKSLRCKFKVEKVPYSIFPDMLIQIGTNLIYQVVSVHPLPNVKIEPLQKYPNLILNHIMNIQLEGAKHKIAFLSDIPSLRTYYNEYYNNLVQNQTSDLDPKLSLKCIAGPLKGEIIDLVIKRINDNIFDVGKSKKECRINIDDISISNMHCKIAWDPTPNLYGWYIYETEPSVFGTYIYLADSIQHDKSLPSYAHIIQNDMVLSVGEFLFRFKVEEEEKNLPSENVDLVSY